MSPCDPRAALPLARRVNDACERFEAEWRAGRRPSVEAALEGWEGADRAALCEELLPLELELRREAGEARGPEDGDCGGRLPGREGPACTGPALAPTVGPGSGGGGPETVPWGLLPGGPGVCPEAKDFGDFEGLVEIARGGMGVVYRARQKSLNRPVALKMVLAGRFASADEMRRFLLEAELAANLDHKNIVPIYQVGEHAGQHYFSMKYVEGVSLAREAPRLLEDPRGAARLLATVARAVHYANARGFVHCDLKPANILLDAGGEPYVTDFGLARRLEDDSTLTATGAVMGTAGYMSPEQASGRRREVTAAADVYGLGAILYELLTGRPPFRAPTLMETVVLVLEREPVPPGRVRPGVPPALEAICLKCLEKAPGDRYPSAEAVADALDQYLRGESSAGSSLGQRLRRWARREPELAARLGGLALVAVLTHYNYFQTPTPLPVLHYSILAVLLLWAVASAGYQALLRRSPNPSAMCYAWACTDLFAYTGLLLILEGYRSNLLVGYPLLIAASGLWSRARLVWFTTALAVAAFALLWLQEIEARPAVDARQHPNIFIAALVLTGFVVARQVNRIWALSTYYENKPAPR